MDKNWQNDPRLADMDKSKLEMLQNLAQLSPPIPSNTARSGSSF